MTNTFRTVSLNQSVYKNYANAYSKKLNKITHCHSSQKADEISEEMKREYNLIKSRTIGRAQAKHTIQIGINRHCRNNNGFSFFYAAIECSLTYQPSIGAQLATSVALFPSPISSLRLTPFLPRILISFIRDYSANKWE